MSLWAQGSPREGVEVARLEAIVATPVAGPPSYLGRVQDLWQQSYFEDLLAIGDWQGQKV